MKTIKTLSVLLLAALLVSCSKSSHQTKTKKTPEATTSVVKNDETSTTATTEKKADGTTSDKKTKNKKEAAKDATYNGSYYTVKGKYGDVVIVNKKHPVAADYNPGEDPTASAAFQKLLAEMQAQGLSISSQYSGFRSYDDQVNLYNSYVAADGQANADRYSARPGYSEHQTGLAYDILDSSGNLLEEPTAVAWLRENAHRFGFVVRYLSEKEDVTGYIAETWHVRYIGEEATDIYQSGLTLEEYYHVAGGDYEE